MSAVTETRRRISETRTMLQAFLGELHSVMHKESALGPASSAARDALRKLLTMETRLQAAVAQLSLQMKLERALTALAGQLHEQRAQLHRAASELQLGVDELASACQAAAAWVEPARRTVALSADELLAFAQRTAYTVAGPAPWADGKAHSAFPLSGDLRRGVLFQALPSSFVSQLRGLGPLEPAAQSGDDAHTAVADAPRQPMRLSLAVAPAAADGDAPPAPIRKRRRDEDDDDDSDDMLHLSLASRGRPGPVKR